MIFDDNSQFRERRGYLLFEEFLEATHESVQIEILLRCIYYENVTCRKWAALKYFGMYRRLYINGRESRALEEMQ